MIRITLDGPFHELTAEIHEGVWSSQDSLLQTQCEVYTLLHPWKPAASNPDPDYDVAQFVAEKLGATITHADEPDYVDGRVYEGSVEHEAQCHVDEMETERRTGKQFQDYPEE